MTAFRRRHASRLALVLALLVAVALQVSGTNPAAAQTTVIGAWRVTENPGLDGTSPMWQGLPPVWVAMTPQQTTPPMGGEVGRMAVRAVHWEGQLFVMLEWADPTPDLDVSRPESFTDAAAIQFPAEAGTAVPAICMGQADGAVNIWQWRAAAESGFPGDDLAAHVDMYPSTEDLFYPARAAGNPMAVGDHPVQNLVAGGFGSLAPVESQVVDGHGVHHNGTWTVVMSRSMDAPGELQPAFSNQAGIDTALAVWNGSLGHRNGIKSVSAFVQLRPTSEPPPATAAGRNTTAALAGVGLVLAMVAGTAFVGLRRSWSRADAS